MYQEEQVARALGDRLAAALPVPVRVEGGGVHWDVEIGGPVRSCVVHCFWYAPLKGLALGMNPSNARAAGRPRVRAREGAEYLVVLREGDRRRAGGRTQSVDDVIACVRAWAERSTPLAEIERALPFVDATRRRMRELSDRLVRRLGEHARCAIEAEIGYELWAYGEARSCQLHVHDDGASCSFLLGQAQVAFAEAPHDPVDAAAAWLVDRVPLAVLARVIPSTRLEMHAEVLEAGDPARWHWLHVRDRLADPHDVLQASRPLVERLLERPLVTQFFSYTSLASLCFSASSHYQWVDDDLPRVWPIEGDDYAVSVGGPHERLSIESTADRIETTLARHAVRPFFGSAPHHERAPLDEELERQRSPFRATLRQRRQWFDLVVDAGDRRCHASARSVTYFDGATRVNADHGTRERLVRSIRAWLEERCSLETLERDFGAKPQTPFGFDPD